MPSDLPTKTSEEIHVEMHPVPGVRASKSSRRDNDKDRKKVIIYSHQHDEDKYSDQCFAKMYGLLTLFNSGRSYSSLKTAHSALSSILP